MLPDFNNVSFGSDEVAAASYIFSSFQLVASEHADLDVGSKQVSQRLGYFVLQAILNCSCTQEYHIVLHAADQLHLELLILLSKIAD